MRQPNEVHFELFLIVDRGQLFVNLIICSYKSLMHPHVRRENTFSKNDNLACANFEEFGVSGISP